MATLKQTLIFYLKVATGASIASYSYLYYRCKKLRDEAKDSELINAKKDTTRPQNVYYGLNWGYRSDNTIEKSLDTGDIFFYDYNCMNLFQPTDVIKCYLQQRKLKEGHPQNMAFCFRTPKKLLIVTSHFDNQIHITPYHEFLNKPYIKTVKVRSFANAPDNIVEQSAAFVQQLREQQKRIQDTDHQDFFTRTLKNKVLKTIFFDKIAQNVVAHYFWHIKVLNRNPFEKPYVTIDDLDDSNPDVFHEGYELSGPIMVRTYASSNLVRSNVT